MLVRYVFPLYLSTCFMSFSCLLLLFNIYIIYLPASYRVTQILDGVFTDAGGHLFASQ